MKKLYLDSKVQIKTKHDEAILARMQQEGWQLITIFNKEEDAKHTQ